MEPRRVLRPPTKTWSGLGSPSISYDLSKKAIGVTAGFRGSASSIMLPLAPPYTAASFLSAGGILGVTPGTALAIATSQVNTVDVSGATPELSTLQGGTFNNPRWFSTGVALPTGEVVAFNGSSTDEVVGPGSGMPVRTPEIYDPASNTWSEVATQARGRTYHSTAVLLPDGRVLVAGHSPIATAYAAQNPAGEPFGLSPARRDPSFEIFSPPYLFRGPRPVVRSVPGSLGYAQRVRVAVDRSCGA